uniref:THD domain-containing protein n=1 Tax=Amphiprion ocellaris TaxID=80972 RepID=A0A3Q1CCP1_AMPOC
MKNPLQFHLLYFCSWCNGKDKILRSSHKIHIKDIIELFENNVDDKTYMKWQSVIGENYSEKDRAVVIPVTGFYFVYVRFALRCHDDDEGFKTFSVQLHRLPFGYNDNVSLADSRDSIKCPSERYRTVFVGQLFELEEEDQVKVSLREGYKLIASSSFGIFRV